MSQAKVTCIITCYKNNPTKIIENILEQTWSNKELLVICSEIDIAPLRKKFPQCQFFDVPNRKDWGHSKRATGITFAQGEYLCFVNDDDVYEPGFLETMVEPLEKEKADFAYALWRDKTTNYQITKAELEIGGITSGSFVVRTKIAQRIGWKATSIYAGDWYFVEALLAEHLKIVYIPTALMTHR